MHACRKSRPYNGPFAFSAILTSELIRRRMTIMEFGLVYSAEQEKCRAEVSEWLDANVPGDINARPGSEQESYQLYLRRRDLGRKLGAKGWLYPSSPPEYGGGGLSVDEVIVLDEETHKRGLGRPPYYDSGGDEG